jgi:hypothetical protein
MRWQGGAEVSGHVMAKSVVLPSRELMICLIARRPEVLAGRRTHGCCASERCTVCVGVGEWVCRWE